VFPNILTISSKNQCASQETYCFKLDRIVPYYLLVLRQKDRMVIELPMGTILGKYSSGVGKAL
jgi:hypothetical protein